MRALIVYINHNTLLRPSLSTEFLMNIYFLVILNYGSVTAIKTTSEHLVRV